MQTKNNTIIGILIILIIIAGIGIYATRRHPGSPAGKQPAASSNTSAVSSSDAPAISSAKPALQPDKVYSFILKPVSNGAGKVDGSLTYENGQLSVGIRGQNLPDPGTDAFYQAWLMTGTTPKSLGKLYHPSDASMANDWVIGYQKQEDLKNYDEVVVSLEKTYDGVIETPLYRSPIQ